MKKFIYLVIVLFAFIGGLFLGPRISLFFEIDNCLDLGGGWVYEYNHCVCPEGREGCITTIKERFL